MGPFLLLVALICETLFALLIPGDRVVVGYTFNESIWLVCPPSQCMWLKSINVSTSTGTVMVLDPQNASRSCGTVAGMFNSTNASPSPLGPVAQFNVSNATLFLEVYCSVHPRLIISRTCPTTAAISISPQVPFYYVSDVDGAGPWPAVLPSVVNFSCTTGFFRRDSVGLHVAPFATWAILNGSLLSSNGTTVVLRCENTTTTTHENSLSSSVATGSGMATQSKSQSCSRSRRPDCPPLILSLPSRTSINSSISLKWNATFSKTMSCMPSISSTGEWMADCSWVLRCKDFKSNGSLIFQSLSVSSDTETSMLEEFLLYNLDLALLRFSVINRTILRSSAYSWSERELLLTGNHTQSATMKIRLRSPFFNTQQPNPDAVTMKVNVAFVCAVFVVYVVNPVAAAGVGTWLPIAIVFGVPVFIGLIVCLCYALSRRFPSQAAKVKKIFGFGPQSEAPLLEIHERHGGGTWMDQAQDVVNDLNKEKIYEIEAREEMSCDVVDDPLGLTTSMIGGKPVHATNASFSVVKTAKPARVHHTRDDNLDFL